MTRPLPLFALASFAAVATLPAQVDWSLLANSGAPDPLCGAAWDSDRGRLVVYGGQLGATQLATMREWDGSQWQTATASALETSVKRNPVTNLVSNRAFDLAYESRSGRLMVAWARHGSSGFRYSRKEPGATSWSAAAVVGSAPSSGVPHFVDLAAEPDGNRIAAGLFDLGDGTERLGLATWDGSAWADAGEYDSQIRDVNDTATGDFAGAVGWVGRSGVAVCIYGDDQTDTLDWARWTSAGGWSVQTDFAMTGKGYTESAVIAPFLATDRLMAAVSDSNGDLFVLTYDGATWTVTNGGTALETSLSSIVSCPMHLAIQSH